MKSNAVTRVLSVAEVLAFDAGVSYTIATAPPTGYMLRFKGAILAKLSGTAVGTVSDVWDFFYVGQSTSLAQVSAADAQNLVSTGTTAATYLVHTELGTDDLDLVAGNCVAKGIEIKATGNTAATDCTLQITVFYDLVKIGL